MRIVRFHEPGRVSYWRAVIVANAKQPDPPTSMVDAVAAEIARARLDPSDPMAVLAVSIAERVDGGHWAAADVRELRLTILSMRDSSTPKTGGDELDRLRRKRRPPPSATG